MVCTFLLIVLPSLALKGMYKFFCWLVGYKPAAQREGEKAGAADGDDDDKAYYQEEG